MNLTAQRIWDDMDPGVSSLICACFGAAMAIWHKDQSEGIVGAVLREEVTTIIHEVCIKTGRYGPDERAEILIRAWERSVEIAKHGPKAKVSR